MLPKKKNYIVKEVEEFWR